MVIFNLIAAEFRDLPKASQLLQNDLFRRSPGGKAYYAEIDRLVATCKAGTLIAAWLLGLRVGATRLEAVDDPWLREPASACDALDDATAPFWVACCARTGLRCAKAILGDENDP